MRKDAWAMKRRAIKHYDSLAEIYDSLYRGEQTAKIRTALESLTLRRTDHVLDVGCGTGFLLEHIGNSVRLTVEADASRKLLKTAAARSKYLNLLTTLLIRADADYLPFRNETFDKIFAFTLLQNMPDPVATLQEITRVAKKESAIVVTGLKKSFCEEKFKSLLAEAKLEPFITFLSEHEKDIISVCRKAEK